MTHRNIIITVIYNALQHCITEDDVVLLRAKGLVFYNLMYVYLVFTITAKNV